MATFQHKLTKDHSLIRVIVGMNQGSPAWWCLQVEKLAWELYKKEIKRPDIDLGKYGAILKKGWGAWPPAHIVAELETAFGITLKNPA